MNGIDRRLISIIMPAYNAGKYIAEAINSVLNQTYTNWELLIVNDGSTDQTRDIILSYKDLRIRYFEQPNAGVSAARNIGLKSMLGDFFCFLDSDDIMPPNSLLSRLKVFNLSSEIYFVDGQVAKFFNSPEVIFERWTPNFYGNPFHDLVRIGGRSFMGISWMIKQVDEKKYSFEEGLSHSEDLAFLISIVQDGGYYAFTAETILYYRQSPNSAMSNIDGLATGYRWLRKKIKTYPKAKFIDRLIYHYKYKKILFLCYLRLTKEYKKAFNVIFE
jgi:teichuronic acid biosynthesis glycosyltransferase TuaG